MQVRRGDKEGDLGATRGGVRLPLSSPILVAEPVRVVVLDCSGMAFADAAGAREVLQVRGGVGGGESPLRIPCIPSDVGFDALPHLHSWPADAETLGSIFSWLSVMVRGVEAGGTWSLGNDRTLGGGKRTRCGFKS